MVNEKFYVIDAHCHVYPEKIAHLAVANTDKFYGEHAVGKGTVQDLLQRGKSEGVDKFIVQSVATTKKQVRAINDFIAGEVKLHSELVGLGTMHPDCDDIKGEIDYLTSIGLKGIKIHPDIQGFYLDDKNYLKMFEYCEEKGVIVLVHTGDYRYDYSNPNRIKPILENFKNLKFIGAHFGGWSIYETASKQLSKYDNFYVDCSSSFEYIDDQTALKIIKQYGSNKIMFGTDYPMWSAEKDIKRLLSLGLDDVDLENIFSKTAIKLFEL